MQVRRPDGASVFHNHGLTGHFAVTAEEVGVHSVCIMNNATEARAVTLNVKTALEVEDHGEAAPPGRALASRMSLVCAQARWRRRSTWRRSRRSSTA